MLNLAELRTAVGNLIERPDSAFVTKIDEFVNERYRSVIGLRPWVALLRQIIVPTVAGRDFIITPQEVDMIIGIHQTATPTILALQKYYQLLHRNIDALSQNDNPTKAMPMGEVGIKAPLSSDGTLSIVSSSSSDTTQTIRIRGYNTAKLPIQESLTLNGTTIVTSSQSYCSVEGYEPKFSKDGDTTGHITISRDGTEIANLAMEEREARYKKWKIWPVPSSSINLYVTFKKRIYKLDQAEDTPELEMDNLLILGAYARSLEEKRQMAKAQKVWGQVDANGQYPPGTYMAELEALISREPNFQENFQDQLIPIIQRDAIDCQGGAGGTMLWPSN